MKTVCVDCKKVLTNEAGERLYSANFNPLVGVIKGILSLQNCNKVTYALCDECSKVYNKYAE